MDIRRENTTKYITLREAAKISGYAADYIGYLIRKGKIEGKRVYTNVSWQIAPEVIIKYCIKMKNLEIGDSFLLKKKSLSLKEAAVVSGYSPDYIGSLIRKGELTGKKVYSGVSWMVNEEDIKRYQEKIEAQKKLDAIKRWRVFEFVSGFFPPIKIPITIKETTKKIVGIQSYKTKRAKIFEFSWRAALIIIILLSFFEIGPVEIWQKLVSAITEEEKTVSLSSTLCEGDWQNPQNAQGKPDVDYLGDFNSFSESNSAIYKEGSLSLVCQNFEKNSEEIKNEDLENLKIQSAKIKLSFAIGEKKPDLEIPQSLPEESAPVTPGETAPLAPEESTPPSSEQPPSTKEEPLPIEQPQNIETPPEVIPTPESVPPSEPQPPAENTVPSASLFKKIQNLFGVLTAEAQEGNIPTEETTPPIEEATPAAEGILSPTENINRSTQEVITPNLDSKIVIWYSLDDKTWWQLDTISKQPLSNFLNSGYFSYDAPFLKSWDDVNHLKIKFEGVIGGETTIVAYLDSVWIEVVYEAEKKNEPQTNNSEAELKEITKIQINDNSLIIPDLQNDFSSNDEPSFIVSEPTIKTEDIVSAGKGRIITERSAVPETYGAAGEGIPTREDFLAPLKSSPPELIPGLLMSSKKKNQNDSISVQLFGFDGLKADILPEIQPILKDGKESFGIKFTKSKNREFKPGLYKLKIELETADNIFLLEQDFRWGVLAINTNKSIYLSSESLAKEDLPPEDAYLQIAALKDDGATLCDANLQLEITDPNSDIKTFKTEDGTIKKSDECGPKTVTYKPDYFAYYQVHEAGIYQMKLTNLDNGYETSDSFQVQEFLPFDVERIGPTRIYPAAKYEMKIIVKTYQDFSGEVIEKLPDSFAITEKEDIRQETNGEEKHIIWDVDWKQREIQELSYQFDAPDISPYLYLLGPLEIGQFKESREWKIVADRTTWYEATCSLSSNTWACYNDAMPTCTATKCRNSGSYNCYKTCTARSNATASSTNCVLNPSSQSTMTCTCSGGNFCNGESGTCTITTNRCDYTCSANWEDCNQVTSDGCECNLLSNTCVGTTCTPLGTTISGTTDLANCAGCVAVAVGNSIQAQTGNILSGTWSISGVTVSSGNIVTVFNNGAADADESTGVTKYDGSDDITGMVLNRHVLSIGSVDNQSLTVTNVGVCGNNNCNGTGDEDIMHSVISSVLNVDDDNAYSDERIDILSGNTLTIGGTETLTTYSLWINGGTLISGGAGTFNIYGFWDNDGVFTHSTETVSFLGDGGNEDFQGTSDANSDIYNVVVNSSGKTFNMATKLIIVNQLTITAGQLQSLGDIWGSLTVGTGNSNGSIICGASCGTLYFISGAAVTLKGAGNFGSADLASDWTFYDLTFGDGSNTKTTTSQGTGTITVSNVLTISASHTLDAGSKTWTLSGTTGTPFVKTGNFTHSTSTVNYTGANAGGNTNVVATDYWNLTLTAADTFDAAGNIEASNVFTIGASATFDAKATTVTLSGTTGTPFVKTGNFTHSTSTVNYTGNADTNIVATTYNNLEFSPTITVSNKTYTGAGAITVGGTLNINPTAGSALSLTFNLGGTTSVTGSTTIQATTLATSLLDTVLGSDRTFNTGSLTIKANGALNGRASALDSNGDVTIEAGGTLTSTSGNFNVGGNWSNSGTFTHSSGTVTFDAGTTGKTISDGGTSCNSPFNNITFNNASGGWTYQDSDDNAPASTTVENSTTDCSVAGACVNFINAKTGSVTVNGGKLNVDWYLGVHVVDAANPSDPIEDIVDGDITISENTAPGDGGPYSTIWKYSGGWGDPGTSKTTSTDGDGNNPQPNNTGAIRIREYSMTNSSTCNQANNFAGCTLYKYNLYIAWQTTYGEYNYYADYGGKYLTSCWAGSTNACSNDTTDDDVIGDSWYRSTIGTMNDVGTVNAPPTNGSWYCGMLAGLSVSINSYSVNLGTITPGAAPKDSPIPTILTVTTSATNGYVITAWSASDPAMTCLPSGGCGSETILDWTGTNASPTTWSSGSYGFGYSTDDETLVAGEGDVNRFSSGSKFAGFLHSGAGDPVADRSSTECPCSNQQNTITYRIAVSPTQRAGPYQTTIIYILTAQY